MAENCSFLTGLENDAFETPGRFIARSIVRDDSEEASDAKDIVQTVKEAIHTLSVQSRSDRGWFGAVSIKVEPSDGMTWSAEAVLRGVMQRHEMLRPHCLSSGVTEFELPEIVKLVGLSKLIRRAIELELCPWSISVIFRASWIFIIAALLLGVLLKVLDAFAKARSAANVSGELTFEWTDGLVLFGIVGIGFVVQLIAKQITATENKVSQLKDRLDRINEKDLDRYSDRLAQDLSRGNFPRLVVIDNYTDLHPITRRVIETYFAKYRNDNDLTSEYWIVFEGDGGDSLGNRVLMNQSTPCFGRTTVYRQLLLDATNRRHLAHVLRLQGVVLEKGPIASLCHGHGAIADKLLEQFEAHRLDHPKPEDGYDSLDFLFLIALNTTANSQPLTVRSLLKRMSDKRVSRNKLLDEILPGTKATQVEFSNRLSDVRRFFGEQNVLDRELGPGAIRVLREAAGTLERSAAKLGLPAPGIVHLYWALYWHDQWGSRPPQAYWVRKIADHLRQSDLSRVVDPQTHGEMQLRVFDALLTTGVRCLETCVLTHVTKLLQQAFHLLQDLAESPGDQQRRDRFLRESWQCLSILGDTDIFGWIVQISADRELPPAAEKVDPESDQLISLFLDTLNLAADERARLGAHVFRAAEEDRRFSSALFGYARAHACWLALSLAPLARYNARVAPLDAADTADKALLDILPQLAKRCKEVETPRHTELLGLTNTLWAYSLSPESNSSRSYEAVTDFAEDAVLLASVIGESTGNGEANRSSKSDFLAQALSWELATVGLASVFSYLHGWLGEMRRDSRWRARSDELLEEALTEDARQRVQAILIHSRELLDTDLPIVAKNDDVFRKEYVSSISRLMSLSAVLWTRFGLPHLSDQMRVRRVQFEAASLGASEGRLQSNLESLGPAIKSANRIGILANIACATSLRSQSFEHTGQFVYRTAEICDKANLGPGLKDAVYLLAVDRCSRLRKDMTTIVEHLVRNDGPNPPLHRFLSGLNEQLVAFTLDVVNCMRFTSKPAVRDQVRGVVTDLAKGNKDVETRDVMIALLAQHEIVERLGAGGRVAVDETLQRFDKPHLDWIYASVLERLLQEDDADERLLDEALKLLERDGDEVSTSFIQLAIHVVGRPDFEKDKYATAVDYIRKQIGHFESMLTAELNITAYLCLYELTSNTVYRERFEYWSALKLERDQLQRLPVLLERGDYFLVFRDYCASMVFWGLEFDGDFSDVRPLSAEDARQNLRQWKATGGVAPSPLSQSTVVSVEFLRIGTWLFVGIEGSDKEFESDRARMNSAAEESMLRLVDAILQLPRLPRMIRRLISAFRQRYDQ